MLATCTVLVTAAVIVATSMLAARLFMHALCRRREQRDWVELVTRNREPDRKLASIWDRR